MAVKSGRGIDSYIGIGEEVAYGTRVAATAYLEHNGESLSKRVNRVRSASIFSHQTHSNRFKRSRISVEGDFSFDARYEGWELILKHLFGTVATSTPDATNASTVREHTFTPASRLPEGLTLEVYRGETDDTNSFWYVGCKIQSCRFSLSNDGILVVSPSIIGRDETEVAKTASPSFGTKELIVFNEATVDFGSRRLETRSFELTFTNPLDAERYFLGSRLRSEPERTGQIEVTGSLLLDFTSRHEYDDFVNATTRRLILNSVGPTIAGGQTYQFTLEVPVADLEEASLNAGDAGIVPQNITFRAYHDSTDVNDIVCRMKNLITSV